MTRQAIRMPRNLPIRNCRRFTGLLIRVTAVRPSISSLIDMLAASTPKSTADEHDHVEADLLHHLVVVAEREVRDDDREPDQRERAEAMSQNIGCRQLSRYAANATAPPFGHTSTSRCAAAAGTDR